MNKNPRIERNPDIMFGKPVIMGTRITVEQILSKLGAGLTPRQVIKDHPHITMGDIHAAQQFAADYLADEDIIFAYKAQAAE